MLRSARDAAITMAAGSAATWIMDVATTKFQERQSAADSARERAVSPGPAYEIAADKTAAAAGIQLDEKTRGAVGMGMHWGLGIGWAPAYLAFRRALGLHPILAGLATGISLFLVVDEGANTVFGFAAPPQDYPAATHLRGAVGHAVYGLALAAIVEAAWGALGWAGVDVHGTRRRWPWDR